MRVFWLLILALLACAITTQMLRRHGALNTQSESGDRIVITRSFDPVPVHDTPIEQRAFETTPASDPVPEDTPSRSATDSEIQATMDTEADERAQLIGQEFVPITDAVEEAGEGQEPELQTELVTERAAESLPEASPEPTGEIVIDLAKIKAPAPDYTVKPDGSILLADGTEITGSGTAEHPFAVDWVTLRSVERTYQPRSGKDGFPGWLKLLDGKIVRVEGNTLLPVISESTRELLVMQNPWDGCCIGIPPTPFDAIEVELVHDVDFGYETVGYGVVTGTFVVDPYVVDGWVLGVYLLKDASYKSDAGTVLPDL